MTKTNRHLIKIFIAVSILFAFAVSASAQQPDLIGAFFVKGKVGLKWGSVDGAETYNIYRQAEGEEFVNIGSTDKTNYFDTDLAGGAVYTYQIAAVVGGNEVKGNTKSVTIPAEIGGFSAPKELEARINARGDGIMLKWDREKSAIAFNILRSTTPGGPYENIGNSTNNKYADQKDLVNGTTYYYVVTAMNDQFEESGYSNEKSMKFGMSQEEIDSLANAEQTIFLDSIDLDLSYKITEADGKELNHPTAIALSSNGDFYITDANNHRVVCFDKDGKYKLKFGKDMYEDQIDNPPDGAFLNPFAIAVGPDNKVYVSDIKRNDIQVFTADGQFIKRLTVNTEGLAPFRSNGLDIYPNGNILTSDVGNERILILDPNGNIVDQFNAGKDLLIHYPNGVSIIDDNTIAYTNPVMGIVAIADKKTKTQKLSFGGQGIAVGLFGRAVCCYLDDDNMLWVVDAMGSNIQAFNQEGEAKLAIGNDKFNDPEIQLTKPRSLVVKDGKIYIVNTSANNILVFNYKVTKIEG